MRTNSVQSRSYSQSRHHALSDPSSMASDASAGARAGVVDVTGNTYSCSVGGLSQSVGEGAELLDDAIISMISYQNDPVPQLRAVLLGDPQCGLATCLLAIELLRNPPAYAADADADDVTDGATGADDGAQVENVAKTAAAASAALAAASSKSTKAEIEKVAAGACLVSLLRAPLTTCLASISLLISFAHSLARAYAQPR